MPGIIFLVRQAVVNMHHRYNIGCHSSCLVDKVLIAAVHENIPDNGTKEKVLCVIVSPFLSVSKCFFPLLSKYVFSLDAWHSSSTSRFDLSG